jgi:hypothetical protein
MLARRALAPTAERRVKPRWLLEMEGPREAIEPRAAQLLGVLWTAVTDRMVSAMTGATTLSPAALAALLWIGRLPGREIFVQEHPVTLSMAEGDTPRKRVEFIFGDFDRRRAIPPDRWL